MATIKHLHLHHKIINHFRTKNTQQSTCLQMTNLICVGIHVLQTLLPQKAAKQIQMSSESFCKWPHTCTLNFPIHYAGPSSKALSRQKSAEHAPTDNNGDGKAHKEINTNLSPKPELTSQVLLKDIIRELDSIISACSGLRNYLFHNRFNVSQNFVLTLSKLTDQSRTSFWLFAPIKTVQLSRNQIEFFISIEELGNS